MMGARGACQTHHSCKLARAKGAVTSETCRHVARGTVTIGTCTREALGTGTSETCRHVARGGVTLGTCTHEALGTVTSETCRHVARGTDQTTVDI